jgi:hypothetical protein
VPRSLKIVVRAPSAKRADQVPIGTSPSLPFGLSDFTCAPSVSTWLTTARAPALSLPGRQARMAPRRVSSYRRPSRSISSEAWRTIVSVYPVGLGISKSAASCARR